MLSQAAEDFLKTIYKLGRRERVGTTALAEALGISAASVTNMAKRMADLRLVNHRAYRGTSLTDAGEKVALEVIRHHRLLETYLREVMGYDWNALHDEAEHLEHHISEAFEDRLDVLLGHPTHDPHGHPIPSREGHVAEVETVSLWDAKAGRLYVVQHVDDDDAAMLDEMAAAGLVPRAVVEPLRQQEARLVCQVGGAPTVVSQAAAERAYLIQT